MVGSGPLEISAACVYRLQMAWLCIAVCSSERMHKYFYSCYMGGGGTSQRVYFACNLEFAVGNFAPTCCEPTFGWCWLWTRLLSIIFHPCKECSKLQAKFASVPCVQQ